MKTIEIGTYAYINLNEKERLTLKYDVIEKVYRLFYKRNGDIFQKYLEGDLIKRAKKLSTINKAAEKYGVEFVAKDVYFTHDEKNRISNKKYPLPYDFCNYGHTIDKYKEEKNKIAIVKSVDYIVRNHKDMSEYQIRQCLSKETWQFNLSDSVFKRYYKEDETELARRKELERQAAQLPHNMPYDY